MKTLQSPEINFTLKRGRRVSFASMEVNLKLFNRYNGNRCDRYPGQWSLRGKFQDKTRGGQASSAQMDKNVFPIRKSLEAPFHRKFYFHVSKTWMYPPKRARGQDKGQLYIVYWQ